MKVYVLIYNCSRYEGIFSSVKKVVEFIKYQYNNIKITRIEQVFDHFYEVYTEYIYKDWDTNEVIVGEHNTYTIIEEELDGTEFYGRT